MKNPKCSRPKIKLRTKKKGNPHEPQNRKSNLAPNFLWGFLGVNIKTPNCISGKQVDPCAAFCAYLGGDN